MTDEEARFVVRVALSQILTHMGPNYSSAVDSLKMAAMAGVRFGVPGFGFTGEDTGELLAKARARDRPAHEALRLISRDLTSRGEPLPFALQEYITNEAAGFKGKPYRTKGSDWERDAAIAAAVTVLCKLHGFNPYRNQDLLKKESASSIVASVLGLHPVPKTPS
jgi:hypothetical protein